MMSLIIGGSGSGKSAYAEQVLASCVFNKYYIAAMKVCDEDGRKKVERHRMLRHGKGFVTVEQPCDIEKAAEKMEGGENSALLECMSNLTANEMFGKKIITASEAVEKILYGVCRLQEKVKHLVIVTNNVFEDGLCYDEGTTEYLKALSSINSRLAFMADEVVEVIAGIPVILKRERNGS